MSNRLLGKISPAAFSFLLLTIFSCFPLAVPAQKLAILAPEQTAQSIVFTEKLEFSLKSKFRIIDRSISEAAFNPLSYNNAFNLSLDESKNIAAAIGCSYFLLVKANTVRRYSLEKKEYFESFAVVYGVSARTGRLIFWQLVSRTAAQPVEAEALLMESANSLAADLAAAIIETKTKEFDEGNKPAIESLPDENSAAARDFRPPLPYRRISPLYTETANLYGIEATVDILVDIDEKGAVAALEISRWAGFGLDESVAKTVREMNWRPASRNGKNLAMQVLLRYNFKKIGD